MIVSTLRKTAFLALLLALAGAVPSGARAEEEGEATESATDNAKKGNEPRTGKRGDELEDKIPAVSGHLFLKDGRHELAAAFDLSLADPFERKYVFGATYSFHLSEGWALTARAGYAALTAVPGYIKVCPSPQQCDRPTTDASDPKVQAAGGALDTLPGRMRLFAGAGVEWAPIYGKLNVIAEQVIHFDLYATAGAGIAMYDLEKAGANAGGISPSGIFGVGQRIFLTRWFAVKLELLDVLFFQPNARVDAQVINQLMFTAAASFFFPTSF